MSPKTLIRAMHFDLFLQFGSTINNLVFSEFLLCGKSFLLVRSPENSRKLHGIATFGSFGTRSSEIMVVHFVVYLFLIKFSEPILLSVSEDKNENGKNVRD